MTHRRAILLALALFLAYAWWFPVPGWNELSRFNLVRAIVEKRSFRIDAYHENTGDKAFFDGHYYSDKAPGAAFLAVPVYLFSRRVLHLSDPSLLLYLATLATVAVPSVICGLTIFIMLRRLKPNCEGMALAAAGAWGLTTIAMPYSSRFFGHQIAASAVFVCFFLLQHIRPLPACRLRYAFCGFLLGVAVLTEYPAALAALALFAYGVSTASSQGCRKTLVAAGMMALGALTCAAFLALYSTACFGHPLANAYQYHVSFGAGMRSGIMGMTVPSLRALWGITLEPGRGLLFLCPFLLLGLPGMVVMLSDRSTRRAGALCAAVVVLFGLFGASYLYWHGISGIGPRLVIPAVPFLVVPAAILAARHWSLAGLMAGLVAVSAFNVWMGTAAPVDPIPEITTVMWGFWRAQFESALVTPNWGHILHIRGGWSIAPLVQSLAILLGAAASSFLSEHLLRAGGFRWRSIACGALVAVLCAAFVMVGQAQADFRNQASFLYSYGEGLATAAVLTNRPIPSEATHRVQAALQLEPRSIAYGATLAALKARENRLAEAENILVELAAAGQPREVFERFVTTCLRLRAFEHARGVLERRIAEDPSDLWAVELLRTLDSQVPASAQPTDSATVN